MPSAESDYTVVHGFLCDASGGTGIWYGRVSAPRAGDSVVLRVTEGYAIREDAEKAAISLAFAMWETEQKLSRARAERKRR
jgi:hypothetical protein